MLVDASPLAQALFIGFPGVVQTMVEHRVAGTLCLLKTPSTAQSLMFARSGSSWPTPMLHLLYAMLVTASSSLKPQRERALQTLSSLQQLAFVLRTTSHRATHPSVEGWNRSGFTRGSDLDSRSPAEAGLSDGGDPNDPKLEPIFRFH